MGNLSPIFVTNEPNDKDLAKALNGLADVRELACGDVNFLGHWEGGQQMWVWGERKKLGDLVGCITSSGRLLRQIQDAHLAGFGFYFLVVEATFREGPRNGMLQHRKGKGWVDYPGSVSYARVLGYLNQLRFYLGIHVCVTHSVRETVGVIKSIYGMFQSPPESHNSLKQFAIGPGPGTVGSYLSKPGLARRIAKELPHIGWDRSEDIVREVGTARELCRVLADGDIERLCNIPGIGKRIVSDINVELDRK